MANENMSSTNPIVRGSEPVARPADVESEPSVDVEAADQVNGGTNRARAALEWLLGEITKFPYNSTLNHYCTCIFRSYALS